jgi:hypothetical protein
MCFKPSDLDVAMDETTHTVLTETCLIARLWSVIESLTAASMVTGIFTSTSMSRTEPQAKGNVHGSSELEKKTIERNQQLAMI